MLFKTSNIFFLSLFMKKTLVIGASENPLRYGNKAVRLLQEFDHDIVALGQKKGIINGTPIITEWSEIPTDIHTITLYLRPQLQDEVFIQRVLSITPVRIIFNPGTENSKFFNDALSRNIETIEACTLVMLRLGSY